MSIEPTTSDNELLSTVAGSSLTPEERQLLESFRRVFGDATLRSLSIFPLPENFLLSVVMPVYNEKETIHEIIQRVRDNPIPKEIIIVDDFSRDGT
ncbi:MAG: glycosyltransferase, partial [bacterium]|nr:glycosyltransferase [bacterium]